MARAGHLLGSLFIQLESRRVALAGVTKHPDAVQGQAFRTRGFEDRSKGGAELGVAVVQDVPLAPQMTRIR
jgi:hypothetical protein